MPSTQDSNYIEREVEIRNPEGLHMRPAMQFVDFANGYSSRISIQKDSQRVDGKSIMQVTMLAAAKGTKLKIIAEGEDAPQAIEALAALIQNETFDNVK